MAPFMAVPSAKAQVEEDLNWLYDNNVSYTRNFWDGSTAKVLWRYSVTGLFSFIESILKCKNIQKIQKLKISEKFKKFQKDSKSRRKSENFKFFCFYV